MAVLDSQLPRLLIVDRDCAARRRLRSQLRSLHGTLPLRSIHEAHDGADALAVAGRQQVDIVLLDLSLPDCSGLDLARALGQSATPPQVVLIAASIDNVAHHVQDLADCLQRPVRTERLAQALVRALARRAGHQGAGQAPGAPDLDYLAVLDRGETRAIPVAQVVFLRAERKYVTIRTPDGEFMTEQTLASLDRAFPDRFVRVHRNSLVARQAIAGAQRVVPVDEGLDAEPYWEVLLHGVPERLAVSRRQWNALRGVLGQSPSGSTMTAGAGAHAIAQATKAQG